MAKIKANSQELKKEKNKKKRRKFIFWWWFGGGLAALTLLVTAMFTNPANNQASSSISSSTTSLASSSISSSVTNQVKLIAVEVDKLPNKLNYQTTDVVSTLGGTLRLVYSDYSVKYVAMNDAMIDTSRLNLSRIGTSSVTLRYEQNGVVLYVSYPINVVPFVINPTKVLLDISATDIVLGQSLNLNYIIEPLNATYSTVVWSSSNNNIASVDQNGVVTTRGVGEVNISVNVNNTLTASSRLNVLNIPVANITGGGSGGSNGGSNNVNSLAIIEAETFSTPLTDAELIAEGWIPISNSAELNLIRSTTSGSQTFSNGGSSLSFTFSSSSLDPTNALRRKYFLKNDISLTPYISNPGWLPISTFRGEFDGRGFTIQNLYINNVTDARVVGLFGVIEDAKISNLNITVKSITNNATLGNQYTSAVAGYSKNSTLERIAVYNVDNLSEIKGFVSIGGITGQAENSKFLRVYNGVNVVGTGSMVGGIVGNLIGSSIIADSHNNGKITAPNYVGGIVSRITNLSDTKVVRNYNSGIVLPTSGANPYFGGIASFILFSSDGSLSMYSNYYLKTETFNQFVLGIGNSTSTTNQPIAAADYEDEAMPLNETQIENINSFAGWSIALSLSTSNKTWLIDTDEYRLVKRPVLFFQRIESVTVSDGWIPISSVVDLNLIRHTTLGTTHTFATGTPFERTFTFASSATNALNGSFTQKYFLTNNIDFTTLSGYNASGSTLTEKWSGVNSGVGWVSIGKIDADPNFELGFSGVLDGRGHTLLNLYINDTQKTGLFNRIEFATVKNIKIVDAEVVSTAGNVGILAGETNNPAAFIGLEYRANISNIVVEDSYVSGATYTGGLIGYADGVIVRNSSFEGSIHPIGSGNSFGGIAGIGSHLNIFNSSADLFMFPLSGSITFAGGLIGQVNLASTVENSYAKGLINGVASDVGGIAGNAGNSLTLLNVYSDVNLQAVPNYGGLVGGTANLAITTTSYWNTYENRSVNDRLTRSAGSAGNSGTGLTSAQLADQASFVDWDFTNVWSIDPSKNDGNPFLKWQTIASDPQ